MAWRPTEYLIEGELDKLDARQGHGLDAVRRIDRESDV